jgi:hypothetical protein
MLICPKSAQLPSRRYLKPNKINFGQLIRIALFQEYRAVLGQKHGTQPLGKRHKSPERSGCDRIELLNGCLIVLWRQMRIPGGHGNCLVPS